MKLSKYKIFILSFFLITVIACNTEKDPCPNELVPPVRGVFIPKNEKITDSISISIIGLNNKKAYSKNIPKYYFIPLKVDSTKTSFIVSIASKKDTTRNFITDTVELTYCSNLFLNDLECGFITEFTIKAVKNTTNRIDSVLIINPSVNSKKTDHVEIYF